MEKSNMMEKNRMDVFSKQDNCLNLFKLIAAFQVMYGHIIIHLEVNRNIYLNKLFEVFQGVPLFFALSGFLIWFSIDRNANKEKYSKYLKKRFWRIYPEMWVAIAVEIVLMCILYNEWNVLDTVLFTIAQSTFFQFWTPNSLRGYGCGVPNGALWTMCVTVQYYVIAWFIYRFMKNRKWFVWVFVIGVSIAISQLGENALVLLNKDIILKLYNQTIIRYLWLFLLGNVLACFFDQIVSFCKKWWPVLFCLGVLVSITRVDVIVGYGVLKTFLVILAIIGFSYQFCHLKLKKDISFGVFIYHMTVINVMITLGCKGKFVYLLIAVAVSCILGYVSTITIGNYASRRK